MQPSQLEIQREVEALRDIRRRSTTQGGPGALILDPDLPNSSSPPSPTTSYWSTAATQQINDGDSSSGSHEDSSSSDERSTPSDDPFHLFWLPARLHPEIAPAEFRAFLKEHARTPPPDGANLGRSSTLSTSSPSLERRRSMLSRQYKPPENDDVVEEETIVPLRRNRSVFSNPSPQLTINDLQHLEELAEEATRDGDPSKFTSVLRRSLSLNVSPSAIDKMDDIPPIPDEADVPIIVPPPGLILRRAARTKIRKSSGTGDVDGRGFSARRRRPANNVAEPRTSSELSSNDHASEPGDSPKQSGRSRTFSTESITSDEAPNRPEPYGEETSIYDAYASREELETELTRSLQALISSQTPILSLTLPEEDLQPAPTDVASEPPLSPPPLELGLKHPVPQRINLAPPPIEERPRTPSPDATLVSSTEETAVTPTSGSMPTSADKPTSPAPKKEKDKRGLFGKWGSDKNAKKSAKAEREREKEIQRVEKEKEKEKEKEREKEREKEKESRFFGSLFSGKKKQEDSSPQAGTFMGSGRETAAALLGASKSPKGLPSSPSPQPGLQGPYARYPIHVERAIYRLSHIKLANPRRPLYEQVLISNLMFWYLGVINKAQNPSPTSPPAQAQQPVAAAPVQQVTEQEEAEMARREAEERQREENERLERERQEREQEQREKERERERERELQQQREKSRRGTLTKPNPAQAGRRAGEMLVKGPQYEMQHRVMEQEYNGPGYSYGSSSASPGAISSPRMYRQASPLINQPQPVVEPQPTGYMYPGPYQGGSDPGVMTPMPDSLPASLPASPAPASRSRSSPSPPPSNGPIQSDSTTQPAPSLRSRSPPSQNQNRYSPSASSPGRSQSARGPMRSLSTTATSGAPLSVDGKARKVNSLHAVAPSPNGKPRAIVGPSRSEEEDVPLAVWQQQRRR